MPIFFSFFSSSVASTPRSRTAGISIFTNLLIHHSRVAALHCSFSWWIFSAVRLKGVSSE